MSHLWGATSPSGGCLDVARVGDAKLHAGRLSFLGGVHRHTDEASLFETPIREYVSTVVLNPRLSLKAPLGYIRHRRLN